MSLDELFEREQTMKIRLLLTLVGLAIGFALPTFAQQTNTPDPKVRDELAALNKKFDEAFVNSDAAALAALYTEDGVHVTFNELPFFGREAIQKHFEDEFKKIQFIKYLSNLEEYSPHVIGTAGNVLWSTGEFDQTYRVEQGNPLRIKGRLLTVLVREGDALKIKVDTFNFAGPPTVAQQADAPPQTNSAPSAEEQSKVDPQVRQKIEALMMKFQEAFNSRDTATIATLQNEDMIEVRSWPKANNGGLASGREALKTRVEADFATNPGKMVNKLVQLYPIGNALCEITDSDVGGWTAQTVTIWVPEGDSWKTRLTYVNNEHLVIDPQVRQQQVEAPFIKFQEAFNNRDVAAIGALLTEDAIEVRSWPVEQNGGLFSGREAQVKMFQTDFVTNPPKMVNKVVALYPIGSAMCEIAHSQVGIYESQTVTIYVYEGDTWKRCMTYIAPL
jgi:ketosteroid isomerase-like protein